MLVQFVKMCERFLLGFRWDSNASIGYPNLEFHEIFLIILNISLNLKNNGAQIDFAILRGELDGIWEEIDYNLHIAIGVAVKLRKNVFRMIFKPLNACQIVG